MGQIPFQAAVSLRLALRVETRPNQGQEEGEEALGPWRRGRKLLVPKTLATAGNWAGQGCVCVGGVVFSAVTSIFAAVTRVQM